MAFAGVFFFLIDIIIEKKYSRRWIQGRESGRRNKEQEADVVQEWRKVMEREGADQEKRWREPTGSGVEVGEGERGVT